MAGLVLEPPSSSRGGGRDMTDRIARCACGALALACRGEPLRVSLCHCTDCQRRTGSAFGVAAFFERAAVTVQSGAAKSFSRDSISGKPVHFHFCPDCGSTVYWEPERQPALIGVAVGSFADPGFAAPAQSVFTDCKHEWLDLPAGMPVHAGLPPASRRQSS
jgi:hypothetical protein